jgi:hypothetical protein
VGIDPVTIAELRAFCMSLPGTHEKETWGDADHAGDVTFRVRDKIYLITGQDGGGWVNVQLDALDPEIVKDIIRSAWRRTAPKGMVASAEGQVG